MTNSNPYVQQIQEQGKEPSLNPAPKRQFPLTIFGRKRLTLKKNIRRHSMNS